MTNKTNSVAHESSKARAEPLETLDASALYDSVVTGKQGLSVLAGLTSIWEVEFFASHFDAQYPVKSGFESKLVSSVVSEGIP